MIRAKPIGVERPPNKADAIFVQPWLSLPGSPFGIILFGRLSLEGWRSGAASAGDRRDLPQVAGCGLACAQQIRGRSARGCGVGGAQAVHLGQPLHQRSAAGTVAHRICPQPTESARFGEHHQRDHVWRTGVSFATTTGGTNYSEVTEAGSHPGRLPLHRWCRQAGGCCSRIGEARISVGSTGQERQNLPLLPVPIPTAVQHQGAQRG
jgi:hypothetical protein